MFKQFLLLLVQLAGIMIGYVLSLILTDAAVPLSPEIIAAANSTSGFLSTPLAFFLNAFTSGIILLWIIKRSSYRGLHLFGQIFVLMFVTQTLQNQIETAYFISAFPLLQHNFQVYVLILRGALLAGLLTLITILTGKVFSKKPSAKPNFEISASKAIKHSSWLAAVYLALYMLFGYFVAWQVKEVRLFYDGPEQLNGFFAQWSVSIMNKPELPVFQYFRGIIWILCLVPVFKGFSGSRSELICFSTLAFALLPSSQLSFSNPLMPAAISYGHYWEILISNGIYGGICAYFLAEPIKEPQRIKNNA